jgi:hypothetical protein
MTKFDSQKLTFLNDHPVRLEDSYDAQANTFDLVSYFRRKAWNCAEFATYNRHFKDFYESMAADIAKELETLLKLTSDLEQATQSGDRLRIVDARYYLVDFLVYCQSMWAAGPVWRKYKTKLRRMQKYWRKQGIKAQRALRAKGLCVHCRQEIKTPKGAWKFACPLCQGSNYAML